MTLMVSGAARLAAWRASATMSPRQLFIGLLAEGFITEAEAIDAARTGAVPAAVEAVIATLGATDQAAARITWARMGVVERTDPLVGMLALAAGQTDAQIDAFFKTYSEL